MASSSSSHYQGLAAGDVAVLPPQSPPVLASSSSSAYYFAASREQQQQRDEEEERCRSCSAQGALVTDWAQGDRVCTQCGVVHAEQLMDATAEWREFEKDRDDGAAHHKKARSGMVPVDESRYAGGLQPTTLSKTIFGRSSTSRAGGNLLLRQRLCKINRRMDRLMERQHRAAYRDAAANVRRRQQEQQQQLQQQLQDDTDTDTVDDSINTSSNNNNTSVEPPNYGSNHVWISEDTTTTTTTETLDEIEEHVRAREEAQMVRRRALEAEKWSLERAQRVGRADEDAQAQHNLPEYRASLTVSHRSNNNDEDDDDEQGLDAKHLAASRELFAAYQMLVQACEQLRLPVTLRDEAAAVLAQYAARRDGLKVKGVAVVARRRNSSGSSSSNLKKKQTLEQQQQQEHNRIRQRGALCAAIVFWTARQRQQPRSLVQVCETVSTAAASQIPIQRKHCSKAMAELKEHLPDWANLAANSAAASAASVSVDSFSVGSSSTTPAAQVASVSYVTELTLRKLNLPLVAEAAVRYLVLHQLLSTTTKDDEKERADDGKKSASPTNTALPTRCAATAYFVCRAGSALQHLASEAQRAAVRQRQRQMQQQEQQQQPPFPHHEKNKKRKWNDDDDDNDSSSSKEHDNFDLLDTAALRSEQQAYETQRLWDAWAEQLPWSRTWAEVEPLPGVGKQAAWDLYRNDLFPARHRLLEELARAAVVVQQQQSPDDNVVSCKSGSAAAVLEQERAVLREASLASILLPPIASAAPLMKADKNYRSL